MPAAVATRRHPAPVTRRKLWCGTALALCMAPAAAWAQTLPNVSNAGGATITTDATAGTMSVDINGANRVVTYNSFNLGTPTSSSETLTFLNSGTAGSYSVLNRVNGGSGSTIYGSISAPSDITVWIVDRQGVTFGPTGSFSGGGLVVSTAQLNGADETAFLAGTLNTLGGASNKPIIFQTGSGAISASGSIVVVGQGVTVDKTMTSSNGAVVLVAATDVSFTDINSPLSFTVSQGTTLTTGVAVGATGNISGQSIALAGGVDNAVTSALLRVDSGATLTATAVGGSIVLATDTTGGIAITNSSGETPGISSAGTLSAAGANADITVTGSGPVALGGSLTAGRNIVLSATDATAGNVTVSGNVTTGSDYQIDARDITLGANATTSSQQAGGAIRINAARNAIGLGNLTVQSNTDATGTEAVSIDAAAGTIDFAGTTSLVGGTAAQRADVVLTSSSDITAGSVTARSLLDSGSLTDLNASGNITLGDVTTDTALRITSTGGSIATGNLVSNTGGVRLDAQAGDAISTGVTAADDITLLASDNIRLASALSTAGSISLTATTGDVSGIQLGAPAGDGRPLANFGRTNLTAGTQGETIAVTATAGTAQLGTLSAGAGTSDLGANQILVTAQAIDLDAATAINGHVDLEGTGAVRAGTLSAGTGTTLSDVIVNTTGAATVDGAVTANRDYLVTGSAVTLGGTAPVTQSAKGAVTIRANSGNIDGTGSLTLQSNSDGAGAETLYLNAVTGAADFAAGSRLLGGLSAGTAAQRSDVLVTSAPTIRLGSVTGTSLRSFGNPTDLTATGAITTGNVTVDQALRIGSATGSVTTGNIESLTANVSLQAGSSILAGTVKARNAIDMLATNDIRLVSGESTLGSITLNALTGLVGGPGAGKADLTANGAGQTVRVAATDSASLGNLSAGSGGAPLGLDQILVTAGSIDLDSATAVDGNVHLITNLGTLRAGSLTAGTPTILADVVVDSAGAATVDGNVSASRDYSVSGASVTLGDAGGAALTQSASGLLTLTATGAIDGTAGLTLQSDTNVTVSTAGAVDLQGAVSALGNYSVTGGSVSLGSAVAPTTQSAGSFLSITATGGNVLGRAGLTLQSGIDTTIGATGSATIQGGVTALRDYSVTGASVSLGDPGGATATQSAGGLLGITATAGDMTGFVGLSLASGGNLTVGASGDVALAGPVSAGATYSVSGTGITLGDAGGTAVTQSASGPISITATTGGVLGNAGLTLQSDLNVTVGATGAVTLAGPVSALGNYTVTGASVTLGDAGGSTALQSAGGFLTVTANSGNATSLAGLSLQSGADVNISASGTAAIAGPVSATGNYIVSATAATLGSATPVTQSAGGFISVAAYGGDATGLAGLTLQSGSDVFVGANGDVSVAGPVSAAGSYTTYGYTVTLGSGAPAIQSAGGPVSITATLGDAVSLAGLTLQSGSDVLVNAAGTASLAGPVSAVGDYTVSGTAVTLGSGGPAMQSAGGLVSITATGGDITGLGGLSLVSGSDVTLSATGAASLTGDVAAVGNYTISGTAVTLGSDAPSTQSAGGFISVSATGGDVTGLAGLTLQSGGDLTVDASGAVAFAGSASAVGNYGVTGTGVTLGSGAPVTQSAGGSISVNATGGNILGRSGLSLISGGDTVASAAGTVTLAGSVMAGGGFGVNGTNVTLGDAAANVTQSASGTVIITASGGIAGLGGLTLQSNSDGVGSELLALDAGGIVDFAPSTTLLGGPVGGPHSDVWIGSAPSLALGSVIGRSLHSISDPTDLVATGSITLGNVTVDQALTVRTAGGTIATGDLTVLGAGQALRLSAGGAVSDLATGALQTDGGDILLSAGRDVAAGAIRTAPAGDPTAGTIAILAGRNLGAASIAAGEDIALSAGAPLVLGAVRTGDDIDILTGGAVSLVSAISTGTGSDGRAVLFDRTLAGEPASITFAGAGGQTGHNITIHAAGLTSPTPLSGETGIGLVVRSLTGGTDATLAANQGDIRVGTLGASGNVDVTASQGSVSGLDSSWSGAPASGGTVLQAPGAIVLDGVGAADFVIGSATAATISTGAGTPANLRLGTVRAGSLTLTAGSNLQIDDAQITGTANLHTLGGSAGAFNLTTPSLVDGHGGADLSGGNLTVTAARAAQLGTLSAGGQIDVTAAAIDISQATAALGSLSLLAGSGRLTLGTGSAGTDAILIKEDADIGLPKTAADNLLTAGTVTAGGIASFRSATSATIGTATAAGGDLTVNAKNDASLGTGAANAGAIRLLAGHDAAATTLSAEDIAVRAGNDANLGTLVAGDNLDLQAGAALTVLSGSTLGAGTDNRSFVLDPALAGTSGAITLGATPAADGDIRLAAGSVTLGQLDSAIGNIAIAASTGDVTGLPGNGAVAVHGAGKSISVTASLGNVQLGPLSAGQGSSTLIGTQIDITAQAIDLLAATATNGGLSLTATDGSLALGTGTAGGAATLVKQGTSGDLTVGSLTATQGISIQSATGAQLGTLQSANGALALTAANGALSLDAGTAGGTATLTKQGSTGNLVVGSLTAAQNVAIQSATNAQLGTVRSTNGALAVTTTGGDLALDSGTAGAGATLLKQGPTGTLTVNSLAAAQDVTVRSDTSAQLGTLQSTGGALTVTAANGALSLDSGTAGAAATLIKQGAAGDLTVGSLTAKQDLSLQSQTNARLGTLRSTNGSLAALAQGEATGLDPAGAGLGLDAFEDGAISAGGVVRIGAARAGDDLSIETPGAVELVSAIANGSVGDGRAIRFDRTRIGQSGGIAFDSPPAIAPAATGSNITIRAASLGGPAMTGDTDTGLVIGTLDGGSVSLTSPQGDIRADKLTASSGDIKASAPNGSVTGRRTGFQSATGGSTISAKGQLILDVAGDVTAGSVTAGTFSNTGQTVSANIRLGSVKADTLALTAANGLQIDSATVSGGATLAINGGTANPNVSGYGTSSMTAGAGKAITVEARNAAQLGALQGGPITVKADAVRIGSARAAGGDVSIESRTALALVGAIETDSSHAVTLTNNGTGSTIIGDSATGGGADMVLDNAVLGQIATGNLVIDSKGRPVTIGKLTIGGNTGTNSFRILSTGSIVLNDAISGSGTGTLQIGGASAADPSGLVDPTQLATEIVADIGESGTRAAVLLPNGTVDLRARRIVFGRTALVDRYLPASGSPPSDASVALDVANAASLLYTSDGTGRQFLTAKRLRVSYANFALFQNTGGPNGAGVALNDTTPPSVATLALQLFGPGDTAPNSFALFGTVNGFIGRAAGILPNEIIEIWSPGGNPRVVRISQGNARLNGCVIGSPDKGCLVNDPPRPNFSIYDQRQTQLFGMADDPLLFFNPLVGRGNEGLIVDIADAPVGIDTIECDPSKGPCSSGEPK